MQLVHGNVVHRGSIHVKQLLGSVLGHHLENRLRWCSVAHSCVVVLALIGAIVLSCCNFNPQSLLGDTKGVQNDGTGWRAHVSVVNAQIWMFAAWEIAMSAGPLLSAQWSGLSWFGAFFVDKILCMHRFNRRGIEGNRRLC